MFDKKAYQREYMAKKRAEKKLTAVPVLANVEHLDRSQRESAGEARESTWTEGVRSPSDSRGGSQIPEREWKYACERAKRAKRYAGMFPDFIRPRDLRYQDPMWQWENEVRGRFGGIIGGSLSGTRGEQRGN